MAGYNGISMSNNAVEAYSEGRKPYSRITKEDILKHEVDVSITFFRWYVKTCCTSNEWHHTSYKYNETWFYDIEECCNRLKKADIEKLKSRYKESQVKPKSDEVIDDNPYYAKVDYSISTRRGRKYLTEYAIIYRCWAYLWNDYYKRIDRKKIDGKHFYISEAVSIQTGGHDRGDCQLHIGEDKQAVGASGNGVKMSCRYALCLLSRGKVMVVIFTDMWYNNDVEG